MQENSFDSTRKDIQDDDRPRRHLRVLKSWKEMQQECHDRIMKRQRLTLAQGMWLYNRYMNCFNEANPTRETQTRMVDELYEARATILRLQHRIEELEGAPFVDLQHLTEE